MEAIEIRSIEQDFEQAQQYVLTLLKKQQSADSVVSETMLVFEALCHDIFAQIKPENAPVTLLGQEKRGYVSIRFTFEGSMYIPGGKEVKGFSPERRILEGYSDKIDYSYHFGYNKILLTVRNSYVKSLLPWAIGALLAVIVYTLLLALTGITAKMNLLHNLVNPLELLFSNAMLMIGAPVTFLSLMKNLTDTYIVAERHSNVRRIRKRIIISFYRQEHPHHRPADFGIFLRRQYLCQEFQFINDFVNCVFKTADIFIRNKLDIIGVFRFTEIEYGQPEFFKNCFFRCIK